MHNCEFCNIKFSSRPQVKNPRACNNNDCQKKRQRSNEKAWKIKHMPGHDKLYHQVQKKKRRQAIKSIVELLLQYLDIGTKLSGKSLNIDDLSPHFSHLFHKLGIRRINKFWINKNTLILST